ncbi:lysozyme inhibitor LprI family protein [Microbulbifer sp. ALW1]|uniref:lysozyme inhibitor LprI family protein n=1 Tax=Microbulbifer sp. (strain ALW1) TaxID=1516059 RepID=UPI00135C9287|nr:lysozyme inhibitor LprI family protein [Microbulbifer sp. ALW1]
MKANCRTAEIRYIVMGPLIAPLIALTACNTPKQEPVADPIQIDPEAVACAIASDPVEKLICQDTELSHLRAELQGIYAQLAEIPEAQPHVGKSERDWLQVRDACRERRCIEMAYHLRIARMQLALDSCKGHGLMESSPQHIGDQCRQAVAGQKPLRTATPMPSSRIKPQPRVARVNFPTEHNASPPAVKGPSFRCEQAVTRVEKEICGSRYLSSLDRQMDAIYQQKRANPEVRDSIRETQLDWLRNERSKCETVTGFSYDSNGKRIVSCIRAAYLARINVLKTVSFGHSEQASKEASE